MTPFSNKTTATVIHNNDPACRGWSTWDFPSPKLEDKRAETNPFWSNPQSIASPKLSFHLRSSPQAPPVPPWPGKWSWPIVPGRANPRRYSSSAGPSGGWSPGSTRTWSQTSSAPAARCRAAGAACHAGLTTGRAERCHEAFCLAEKIVALFEPKVAIVLYDLLWDRFSGRVARAKSRGSFWTKVECDWGHWWGLSLEKGNLMVATCESGVVMFNGAYVCLNPCESTGEYPLGKRLLSSHSTHYALLIADLRS